MSRWLLAGLVVLTACGRAAADKEERASAADEVAPPSILALIASEEIDSAAARLKSEDREIRPTAPNGNIRRLSLWRIDGRPAKLMVSEATHDGRLTGLSVWYFRDGQMVYARELFARYAFDGGRLVEWTDQHGVVAASDAGTLREREKNLRETADLWLKEFAP